METTKVIESTNNTKNNPNKTRLILLAILLLVVSILLSFWAGFRQGQASSIANASFDQGQQQAAIHIEGQVTDLNSIDELRILFEQDAGKPRLILLVSPT